VSRDDKEFRLTCIIADMLRLLAYSNVSWFHVPNGEHRSARTGARLKRMGVKRGVADFIIQCRGKGIALELKAEGGRQTPEQRDFQAEWEAAGGDYYLCKGYEETVEKLEWLRIIRPVKGNERFEPRTHAA